MSVFPVQKPVSVCKEENQYQFVQYMDHYLHLVTVQTSVLVQEPVSVCPLQKTVSVHLQVQQVQLLVYTVQEPVSRHPVQEAISTMLTTRTNITMSSTETSISKSTKTYQYQHIQFKNQCHYIRQKNLNQAFVTVTEKRSKTN